MTEDLSPKALVIVERLLELLGKKRRMASQSKWQCYEHLNLGVMKMNMHLNIFT